MITKAFEIRDSMTFIPVIATLMEGVTAHEDIRFSERYLLARSGYGVGTGLVLVTRLSDNKSSYDPYEWSSTTRTMQVAHDFIHKNFWLLKSGDVVDVEYILDERNAPKISERLEGSQ